MTVHGRLHLVVLEAALDEIVDQAGYFEEASGRELADRWGVAVSSTIQSLQTMPDRGAPCLLSAPQLRELRRIPVGEFERYSVFYHAATDLGVLTVVAVLHMYRDIARILETARE